LAAASELISQNRLGAAELALDSALAISTADSSAIRRLVKLAVGKIELRRGNYRSIDLMLEDVAANDDFPVDSTAIEAQILRSRALIRLGRFDDAIYAIDRALESAERAFGVDNFLVGSALHYRGLALHESGSLIHALDSYWPAVEVRTRVHGKYSREVAASYNNIGNVYWRLGLFDRAIETHFAALAIKQEILTPRDPEIAITFGNLANLLVITRDSSRAEFYYAEALRIYAAGESNPLFVAKTKDNFGELLMSSGRLEEATHQLVAANATFKRLLPPGHGSVGVSEVHMGRLDLLQGKKSGLQRLQDGTEIMIRAGRPDAAYEVGSYAESLFAQGLSERGARAVEDAMDLTKARYGDQHPTFVRLTNLRAKNLLRDGAFQRAANLLEVNIEQALRWSAAPSSEDVISRDRLSDGDFVDSVTLWSESLAGMAQSNDLRGADLRNASRKLLSIVRMLENEASLGDDLIGNASSQSLHSVVRAAQDLHIQLFRRDPSRTNLDLVFRLAETSLAGKLHSASARSAAVNFGHVPASLIQREQRLLSGLSLSQRELVAWGKSSAASRPPSLMRRHYAYRDSIDHLIAILHTQYPRYHAMRFGTGTAALSRVRDQLGSQRELIQYHIVSDSLYGIIIGDREPAFLALGSINRLSEQVDRYLTVLQGGSPNDILAQGAILYDQLLAPLAPSKEAREWVIVPDGPLLNLPFEALVSDSEDDSTARGVFLVEEKTITYTHSATLFATPPAAKGKLAPEALFLAAPVFSGGVKFQSSLLGAGDGMISFSELRGTGREAVAIDRLFDANRRARAGKVELLLGEASTERALKEIGLNQFRYVHLATHGYANPVHPSLSGLLLHPGNGEDGILHVGEVLGLELNAEMVVLSACRTAIAASKNGKGLMSLTGAFLYAGTNTVVASLWNSDDAYTAATMAHFYNNILSGQPKAEALRQAKLKLMEDPEVAARPGLWAPFILIGQS
jgi:CHAT domain-containing protein